MKAEQFKALMANKLPAKPNPPVRVLDGEIAYGPTTELNGCHYWFHSNCRVRGPLNIDEWCEWCLKKESEEEMAGLNPDVPPENYAEVTIPDDDDKKEFVSEIQYSLHLLNEIRGLLVYLADPKLCTNLQPPDRKECAAKVADIDAFFEDQEYQDDDPEDDEDKEIELDFEELDLELDSEMTARDAEILNRVVDNLPFRKEML